MKYKVTLRGKTYEVEVEKGNAILLDEYEAKAPSTPPVVPTLSAEPAAIPPTNGTQSVHAAADAVAAPIPGTIISVDVSKGQSVKKGQLLVVIESMKMENEILSPEDGTISEVYVSSGDSVASGAALLIID